MLDFALHMTKPDKQHTYAKQRVIIVFRIIHSTLFREIRALSATVVVTEPLMLLSQ
jgi:hypothetical protein